MFFAGTPAAEEGRRFIFEIDLPPRASRSSALIFLYSASWVAVISSPSVPEWVFLHLFTQHPHGLRDQNRSTSPPAWPCRDFSTTTRHDLLFELFTVPWMLT